MTPLSLRLRALVLSEVVTRVVKTPAVDLTTRHVAAAVEVMVPTRHGEVRCLITRPAAGAPLADATTPPPVYVHLHGGAFLIGAPHQDDHLVRMIASEVGAVVVNVDYSTAPRARFPQAHEEAFDVLDWVARSGERMGWDSTRLAIGGQSAGANLALGALEQARRAGAPAVAASVLLVPAVDMTVPPESYVSDIARPMVNASMIRTTQGSYFADSERRADPLASPMFADELLTSLPPTLVAAAQHDSMRPQIEDFVVKARELGSTVRYELFRGVDHDFPLKADGPAGTLQRLGRVIADHLSARLAP